MANDKMTGSQFVFLIVAAVILAVIIIGVLGLFTDALIR